MSRVVIGAVGVLLGGYGAWLLLSRQDGEQVRSALVWLAAGVVLHDVAVALVTLVVGALCVRVVPRVARGAVAAGLVVWGSVTLLAVPVLGRFGARPDNPTLLDRPYWTGWLVLSGVVALAVGVGVLVARRRSAARGSLRGPSR